MSRTLTLPDGRTFPQYHGEPLSWSIALYLTPAESAQDYPRARAVIRAMQAHRAAALAHERHAVLRGSFNAMFGHNARLVARLIAEETQPEKEDHA